ncbi:hypothetical protein [Polystyrenella longa]|nr:hypothetical protein [Polystyrenella longa]
MNAQSEPESMDNPRRPASLKRRLFKVLIFLGLLAVVGFVASWWLAVPYYLAGSPTLERDSEGKYDIPLDASSGRAWLPGVGGPHLKMNAQISGVEVSGNLLMARFGHWPHFSRLEYEGIYTMLDDVVVICHSEDPLTRFFVLELVELIEAENLGKTLRCYSAEEAAELDGRLPDADLYIELFGADKLATVGDTAPSSQVLMHVHTDPVPHPLSWDFKYPINLRSFNRFHLIEANLDQYGNYSTRAKLAVFIGEVMEYYQPSFELLSNITPVTVRVDLSRDIYFPAKQPLPIFQFLVDPRLKEVQSRHGFLTPQEAVWRLSLTEEESDEFQKDLRDELESAGWE